MRHGRGPVADPPNLLHARVSSLAARSSVWAVLGGLFCADSTANNLFVSRLLESPVPSDLGLALA